MIQKFITLILIPFVVCCVIAFDTQNVKNYDNTTSSNITETINNVRRSEMRSDTPKIVYNIDKDKNYSEVKNVSEAVSELINNIQATEQEEPLEQTESIEVQSVKSAVEIKKTDILSDDTETITEEIAKRGNIGRLVIPSVGVNVAVFEVSIYDERNQAVVDGLDSAAYMSDSIDYYGFIIVGDHVHQGFSAIKNSVVGATTMYIDKGTYKENYICTDIFIGYNGYGGELGMFDIDGNDVAGRNDGGMCLYTCNSNGTITITFWQPM